MIRKSIIFKPLPRFGDRSLDDLQIAIDNTGVLDRYKIISDVFPHPSNHPLPLSVVTDADKQDFTSFLPASFYVRIRTFKIRRRIEYRSPLFKRFFAQHDI